MVEYFIYKILFFYMGIMGFWLSQNEKICSSIKQINESKNLNYPPGVFLTERLGEKNAIQNKKITR